MTESPLHRFLNAVAKEEQPSLSDLRFITEALIRMRDSGESFKKAFGLNSSKGRKPSKSVNTPVTKSFRSMSEGWLGQGPFWLNRFLSAVDQQRIPKADDLKSMAHALRELELMNNPSLVAAFDMRQKTSSKKLMEDFNLNRFYKSHELEVYLIYRQQAGETEQFRKMDYDAELLHQTSEIASYSIGHIYSEEHIWRMVKAVSEYYYLLNSAKKSQEESWKIYDSYCCHLKQNTDIQKSIAGLLGEYKSKKPCLILVSLYEEVLKNQKYALIMTGKRQYPPDLKRLVKANLEPISQITKSVENIPKNTQVAISFLYATATAKNTSSSEAINSISYQLKIEPRLIEFYLSAF
jgi:hypothetical protein